MNRLSRVLLATSIACLSAVPAYADLKSALIALDDKEYEKSAKMLAAAFEAGEYDAAFYMGRMLELGLTGAPDINGAIALYATGSAMGSSLAKNRLGILHMEGVGVLQDYKQGAKLICEAANVGEQNAEYNCGALYQEGKGVSVDSAKAIDYFKRAAIQGNVAARNMLADIYAGGKGIDVDAKKAFDLWQQTAAVGNPYGLFMLAKNYSEGTGADKDLIKAHAYANLAAARGVAGASEMRASIETKLSPDDVVTAQQVARSWRPAPDAEASGNRGTQLNAPGPDKSERATRSEKKKN
ncbi:MULTISPECIES: tetratricopeptide repeat protein [Mesorhizobium]|uniref:Sel1 repeat family protein n=1 Tax=Mesorhizobium denitrificans TaxID=2294114 RepID=A0A371X1Y2_9HYPH|nr:MULTISPECIES: tetratricopeptide repeat protein [Mesorhizobium]RFC63236.1 sel1 repeat family protein [Mesorhizobium denitrificans]